MRTTVKHHAAGTVKRTVPCKDFYIFFINWGMATDIKLKDYILYKYKERIKKRTHYMLSIISSGNRGCCSSTVPMREPPLMRRPKARVRESKVEAVKKAKVPDLSRYALIS
jgi:hypothetical protein